MTISSLPDDILRQLLETAVYSHPRTALKLAIVCKPIHQWINDVIYQNVILKNQRSARAFLRSVVNANPTRRAFLATTVKSIFMYSDIELECIVPILSACSGMRSLSYWPSSPPYTSGLIAGTPMRTGHADTNRHHRAPLFSVDQRRVPRIQHGDAFNLQNLNYTYPQHLSLLLHELHPILIFRPTLRMSFFANVTHLSILNKWQDWTSWAGGEITRESMPFLTHLKLDMSVGPAPPHENAPTRSNWLEVVNGASPPPPSSDSEHGFPEENMSDAMNHWRNKIYRVSRAIREILSCHSTLQVCVLILRSDRDPSYAAKHISRSVSSSRALEDPSAMDTREDDTFDQRLVFAWEKQPFRYSYAHSHREEMIWKSAHAVAQAQRYLSGYTLLDCDHLA